MDFDVLDGVKIGVKFQTGQMKEWMDGHSL